MQSKSSLNDEQIKKLRLLRWRGRTDIAWLCRNVLNYKDVDDYVHGPMMNILQKFPKPTEKEAIDHDYFDGKVWKYKPLRANMQELPGVDRKRLILVARSHLKTYINAQAHTIQWILNYPDINIAIFQSNTEKADLILKAIKDVFKYNPRFRELYPEHCPPLKKADDFGVTNSFSTMARDRSLPQREPTVIALSIDKGTAGMHFHVIKYSDIVEPENVKSKERMEKIKDSFTMCHSLLVTTNHWEDVEGTIYHPNDLYCKLIENWHEEKRNGKKHSFVIHIQAAYKCLDPTTGKEQTTFTPETQDWEFMRDTQGRFIPWWQKDASGNTRFTYESLEAERAESNYIFSCQKLLRPKSTADGEEIFPENKFFYYPKDKYKQNISIVFRTVSVDTAETVGDRSDHSVITVCGWDMANTCFVEKIYRAKLKPDQLIDKIFEVHKLHNPSKIIIEETGFTRGLSVGIRQRMQTKNIYLPLAFVKPSNQKTKEEKIQNTLQPVYNNGKLRFVAPWVMGQDIESASVEDQAAWRALQSELKTFPKSASDDILDSICYQFENKEWLGRLTSRGITLASEQEDAITRGWNIRLGFTLEDSDGDSEYN